MIPQLFLDLDGVLADFDGYYESLFGVRPNQDTYEPPEMWDRIRENKTFYRDQPPMKDAMALWEGAKKLHPYPIILTGIPRSIPYVAQHKRHWVDRHLGTDVHLICCRSIDKCEYGLKGDILVDDRLKYSHLWENMGGTFVLHVSASETLRELNKLFLRATGRT